MNEIKAGRIKIAQLSKETGIPAGRMYKWKGRGSKITSEDAEILKAWFNKTDNSLKNAPVIALEAQDGHKGKKAGKTNDEFSDSIDMTTMTMKPTFGEKPGVKVTIEELQKRIIQLEAEKKTLQEMIDKLLQKR